MTLPSQPAPVEKQVQSDAAPLLVAFDSAQRICHANRAMLELVGKTQQTIRGLTASQAWAEIEIELEHPFEGQACHLLLGNDQPQKMLKRVLPFAMGQWSLVIYAPLVEGTEAGSHGLLSSPSQNAIPEANLRTFVAALASILDVHYAVLYRNQVDEAEFKIHLFWNRGQFKKPDTFLQGSASFLNSFEGDDYFSHQNTWQRFPDHPFLKKAQVDCLASIALKDSNGQLRGRLALMHHFSKPEDWTGMALMQAAGRSLSDALSRCQMEPSSYRQTRVLEGIRELSLLLHEKLELVPFLEKVTARIRSIFASDHVWIAQLPRLGDSEGLLVEAREETCPPLSPLNENHIRQLPDWHQLGDLATERDRPLFHIPPYQRARIAKKPILARKHLILHLRACEEFTWLFGVLPHFEDSTQAPVSENNPFQHVALKVCDLVRHYVMADALRQSRSQGEFLLQHMREVVFETDAGLRLQNLNPAWESLMGFSIAESLGCYLGDFFTEADGNDHEVLLGGMIQVSPVAQTWEVPLKTKSRGFIWVQIQAKPHFDAEGQFCKLSGILRELGQEMPSATAKDNDLAAVVETSSQIAVQSYDPQLKVLTWNQASQDIFGFTPEEAKNKQLKDLILPESATPCFEQGIQNWLEHGQPFEPGELKLRRKNGELLNIYASHTLMHHPDGTPEFFMIGIDLTDQKQTQAALIESERRYRSLVELSPQAMFLLAKDQIIFANPAGIVLLGANDTKSVLGKDFTSMAAKSFQASLRAKLAGIFSQTPGDSRPLQFESFEISRMDGRLMEVEIVAMPVAYAGETAIQIIAKDITRQKQAAEALRMSEARYALAAQGSNDGLWDWDLKTDRVYYSPRWHSMLGLEDTSSDATSGFWLDRIHADDLKNFNHKLEAHLDGRVPQFENEHRLQHADGAYRWMLCRGVAIFDRQGQAIRMAGSLRDITERKKVEHQLFHDAFHDSLTGLANRALFMEHLDRAMHRNMRGSDKLTAIIFIDFDRFKLVNDSLGHLVGDKLLIAIAQRLTKALPSNDLLARLGGDEFAILIEDIEFPVQVRNRSQTIHSSLKEPFFIEGNELYTSVSIGIAFGVPGRDKPMDVLRDADTAMYRAKERGKAQSVVFDQTMHDEVQRVMTLENDMRKAMDRNEFEVFYQPIFDLRSLRLAGFEALLRWNHPVNGVIYPNQFIGLAEETGIILDLGLKVLHQACLMMADLHRNQQDQLFLHVNLSFRQMMQSDLKGEIEHILLETGMAPDFLKLELTESIVAEPGDFAVALLHDLRQLGIRLCLDDFGTGYASLSYLHRLPIDSLKIDKSFIDRLLICENNKSMVPTIISLAHNLGLTVVAEGVENEAQFRRLLDLGCEFAQGFHFSKPVSLEAAKNMCMNAAGPQDQSMGV